MRRGVELEYNHKHAFDENDKAMNSLIDVLKQWKPTL